MRRPTVHIIGAGFSGLSAAIHLSAASDAEIVVHERAAQAGGRRRSFHDAALGMSIDSGNYFVLASWRSTLAMIAEIGAEAQWREEGGGGVAFADMASGERWTLRPNAGRIPWWVLIAKRRAPLTRAADHAAVLRLLRAPANAVVSDCAPRSGPAAERLWRPFTLAGLNVEPNRASARLAGAVLRETFDGGGRGARTLFPAHDFARAFVEPALKHLRRNDVAVRFERDLRAVDFDGDRVVALDFEHDRIDLAPDEAVILAVPPGVAGSLAPGISAPTEFSASVTAHFAESPPPGAPRMLGVLNGPFSWMFCGPDRISAVARDAGAMMETPREKLAAEFWAAAAALTGLSDTVPAWRIIRQKRATFAATPEQDALRPTCETPWSNLFLAGAYVQNGLPESIESAVRSGGVAARRAIAAMAALGGVAGTGEAGAGMAARSRVE
jgi:squalene-associated FAD-dependent desaturase